MNWPAIITLSVLAVLVYGLIRYTHVVDVIFVGGLTILTLAGIVTPQEALAGFANEGVVTIAALFVVAAGLVETGLLAGLTRRLLGRVQTVQGALVRVVPSVVGLSAFLNNTTVVAMSLPALMDWSRKRRIAASKLLLPLSFAAIMGGVCTLIGTSTNLVIHGMLKAADLNGYGMWDLAPAGVPIAIIGSVLLVFLAPRLLPERKEFLEQLGESRREFLVEMLVQPNCPLLGQTIEAAGLRHLPGLFLIEIERNGEQLAPVEPDERLRAADRLVFTGVVSTIVDLQKIPGLVPAGDERSAVDLAERSGLCEAVISSSSPLVGQGIRDANFRTIYDAAVIAVHRNGVRLRQKIGDIALRPGDTLLLLTGTAFVRAHRNNPDFYLVSQVGAMEALRSAKAGLAAAIAGLMLVLMTLPDVLAPMGVDRAVTEWLDGSRAIFALLAAGGMVVTRCISATAARRSIDWQVLVIIAAALGLGRAMKSSGAAELLARTFTDGLGLASPLALLAAIYLLTWVLTEVMSNNAAAALMFPIAVATAARTGTDPRPFAVAVTLAASAGFVLPMGYQTHLMVFGPGGYRLSDFVKIGLPMSALWFAMAMALIPVFWPL